MSSASSIGINILLKVGSLFLAFKSLCRNGSSPANKFLLSYDNRRTKNSFFVSLRTLMIISFLGSLTSMYNCLSSIKVSSYYVYSLRFLADLGFLNKFSDLIGGMWAPLFFHSAFTKRWPVISPIYNFFSSSSFLSCSAIIFFFYSSVRTPSGLDEVSANFFYTLRLSYCSLLKGNYWIN